MIGHMTELMRPVAEAALAEGAEEVTVGTVYDGLTPDGTVMLAEVCEPDFDESRYWVWKTYKKEY